MAKANERGRVLVGGVAVADLETWTPEGMDLSDSKDMKAIVVEPPADFNGKLQMASGVAGIFEHGVLVGIEGNPYDPQVRLLKKFLGMGGEVSVG